MTAGGGNFGSSYNTNVGIATLAASLSSWATSNCTGGIGMNAYQGHIYVNGADALVGGTGLNTGDVVCMAIDLGNKRAWFRVNGGNWNWNATNNPATNIGGIDISAVFSGGISAYPMAGFYINGDAATVNFGASSFSFAAPSGFTNWAHTATWNNSDKLNTVTLSGGNLTATNGTSSTITSAIRGTTGVS